MKRTHSRIWLQMAALCVPLLTVTPMTQAASQTQVVTDAQGQHTIPLHPKKMVVYNPTILDTLDALGVQVAAVPQNETSYPPFMAKYKSKNYLNAGSMFEPDLEALSRFKPDLIIGGGRTTEADAQLNKLAPTIDLDRDDLTFPDSIRQQTLELGKIFGKEDKAKQLVAQLDSEMKQVKPVSSKAGSALVLIVTGGHMSAFGPGSRFGFIYDGLDFKPAIAKLDKQSKHGNNLSAELIHEANPDWVFVIDRDAAIGFHKAAPAAQVLNNPLVNSTNAAKNHHIVFLNAAELYVAGGITTYLHAIHDVGQALQTAQK